MVICLQSKNIMAEEQRTGTSHLIAVKKQRTKGGARVRDTLQGQTSSIRPHLLIEHFIMNFS